MPDPITISDYDDNWPQEFTVIASRLRGACQSLAARIDHIGSTSVPGLAAKNRIDIQISVRTSDDYESLGKALESIGYTKSPVQCDHVPPGGPHEPAQWEKRLYRPPGNQRPTNLHVRVDGCANQRYPLLFRDYLRSFPDIARAYELVKKQLAQYHPENIEAYCDIKDPVCDIIAIQAKTWAEQTKWQPGQSDA